MDLYTAVEKQIISGLLTNGDIFKRYIHRIKIEFFLTPDYIWYMTRILQFYEEYHSQITRDAFVLMINSSFTDENQIKTKILLLDGFLEKQLLVEDFVSYYDKLVNKYLLTDLAKIKTDFYEKLTIDNVKNLLPTLQQNIDKYNNILQKEIISRDVLGVDMLDYFFNSQIDSFSIPSGFTQLDTITGGWRRGELITLSAPSGQGKSVFLLNMARNAFKAGYNSLLVSLELTKIELLQRYLSLVSRIAVDKIRKFDLTPKEKRLLIGMLSLEHIDISDHAQFKEWFHDDKTPRLSELLPKIMKFKPCPNRFGMFVIPNKCTVDDLRREIDVFKKHNELDFLVVDHFNHLTSSYRTDNYWYNLGMCAKELKGLALEYSIPILTAAQLKTPKKNEELSQEFIKYTRMLVEFSDYVFAYTVTEEDTILNKITLRILKARASSRVGQIELTDNFRFMRLDDYGTNTNTPGTNNGQP